MTNSKDESVSYESAEAKAEEKPKEDASNEVKIEKEPADKQPNKKSLQERLEAEKAKAKDNYDRLLRVTAEFDNYRKRMDREMTHFRQYANESLIKEVLPIVDNLERALSMEYDQNENAFQAMRTGVQMTLKGLQDTLKKFGVVPVEALEKPFDPNFHQAISPEESEEYPEDIVLRELQKGYVLNGRLLRPAMVVVSKKPGEKPEASTSPKAEKQVEQDIPIQ